MSKMLRTSNLEIRMARSSRRKCFAFSALFLMIAISAIYDNSYHVVFDNRIRYRYTFVVPIMFSLSLFGLLFPSCLCLAGGSVPIDQFDSEEYEELLSESKKAAELSTAWAIGLGIVMGVWRCCDMSTHFTLVDFVESIKRWK